MNRSLFLLVILLANPVPSFTEPSGKLGCRFSPLCNKDELCAEDKLFGTCTHRLASYLPSYDLDPVGLRRLKDVVQYLLDQGFAWEDQYAQLNKQDVSWKHLQLYEWDIGEGRSALGFRRLHRITKEHVDLTPALRMRVYLAAQDSLQQVLSPFKQNFIPLTTDPRPEAPSTEEMDTWEKVDRLARAYKAIMDEYKDRYSAYEELVNQYGFGDNAELNEYAQAMQEKYARILRELQVEERENLRKLYNLYYEEYLRLLKEEMTGPGDGGLNMQGGWDGMSREDGDWKGLHKIQLLKEYLQLMYNENRDRWVTTSDKQPQSDYSSLSSSSVYDYPLETFQDEWKGDFSSEVVDGVGDTVAIQPAVDMETEVAEPLEEGAQGEDDIWDAVLGDVNQEYWNSLTEDQKNEIIEELLQLNANNVDGSQDIFRGPESQDVELEKKGGNEHQDDGKLKTAEKGDNSQDAPSSKEHVVEKSGKELVEPLKQPKESGLHLDVALAKKDEDAVAVVTQQPSGKDVTKRVPTTSKATTFAPSGFVFIALQSGISLTEAKIVVEELANTLDAPDGSFTEIETGEKQITFRVNPDVIRMTPAEVAEAAASHKADLESMLGVTITETGVGKQTHITVLDAPRDDNPTLIVVTVVLVACIVGILIAVITVYCYRQRARNWTKFKGLSSNGGAVEGEATADYQDLCRQRMASKSSEKPEPLTRISSVAMSSEGAVPSPSSRSSTSSWSEEPVQSNMDISTGHIVLAYMEDHLRNKDRITKEWEALCRYEPDISSTKIGALPINMPRNRYQDILPYDHTRVLLNDSTNALSSDYINASTIADADPRNPAYIATQAPLPTTIADFWQMVWEQGVVVIVNLTPMTDSDTVHTLYWPTEGGTRYHFYEVHLVSEHVWCEDYLVRSFYLKNTETQETRTVTQFHFLTWPENGIPPTPKALLEFRRKVNKSYRGKACPIVVHCSDGVGRTGTYCLVDMVLTRMTKGAKEIDIAATLEHIRDQRPGAVKLKEQFEFALTALAEEVNAILKALPQ